MQKQNIGNAGEYYLASRLSAENFVATITLGRAETYDILAVNPRGKTFKLSVKCRMLQNARDFPLSIRDETKSSPDFYYALIRLNSFKKNPDFWIIPSGRLSKLIKDSHKKWLETSGINKRKHNDTSLRKLPVGKLRKGEIGLYPNSWEKEVNDYYMNFSQLK